MQHQLTLLITTAVVLAIVSAFLVVGFLPLHKQHRNDETALQGATMRIAELHSRIHELPALKAEYTMRLAERGRLSNLLVNPDSVSGAVGQIHELCRQYQLNLKRVTAVVDTVWSVEPESEFSAPLTLLLRLEGRFLDYGLMIENSSKLPFYFQITDFRIVKPEDGSTLTIEARAAIRLRKDSHEAVR